VNLKTAKALGFTVPLSNLRGACIILSTPLPRRGKTHQRARQHPSLDVHLIVHLEGNFVLEAFGFYGLSI
jgi:hypothetical protein